MDFRTSPARPGRGRLVAWAAALAAGRPASADGAALARDASDPMARRNAIPWARGDASASEILPSYGREHGVRHRSRRRVPPEVGRVQGGIGGDAFDRAHQAVGGALFAEMGEHQRAGPEAADRIGDPLAGDVEGRAVDRLEHRGKRPLGIEVGGRGDAERAGERGGEIGQDIGVQVGRHDRVERRRLQRHPHRHRVDQHLVPCDLGEFARDLGPDLVPHHHRVALRIRLGDHRQLLARARAREPEREAEDSLDPGAGHHRNVRGDLRLADRGGPARRPRHIRLPNSRARSPSRARGRRHGAAG